MDDDIKKEMTRCVKVGFDAGIDVGLAIGFASAALSLCLLGHFYAGACFALAAASKTVQARATYGAFTVWRKS